jgi:hypothetical protein
MLTIRPLPNDLLNNPPWVDTISSWRINESLLTADHELIVEINKAGYDLQFGLEINLGLLNSKESSIHRRYEYWRRACQEQFARDQKHAETTSIFSDTAAKMQDTLAVYAERHKHKPTEDSAEWLRQYDMTQGFYNQVSSVGVSEKVTALAQKNYMIAILHLLPPHLGGLRSLIEQRFASEHYGYGWWDGENIPEFRTLPLSGIEPTINNYHHILWRLKQAVEAFGFVPVVDEAYAQVHFSLWRLSDGVNIMADDSAECLDIRQRMGDAFYKLMHTLPLGKFSRDMDASQNVTGSPFLGSSRVSTLRTHHQTWELRQQCSAGVTHLARDLFLITTAVEQSLATPSEDSELIAKFNESQKHTKQTIANLANYGDYPVRNAQRTQRLYITSHLPRTACPFISCLEGATLDENRNLVVADAIIEWNFSLLTKAIGRYGLDLFSIYKDERTLNLQYIEPWVRLFNKIHVNEDNTLDTSKLPAALARHFEGLAVAAIRQDVVIPQERQCIKSDWRLPHDAMIMRGLEQGHLTVGDSAPRSEELQRAHQEIFGFMADRDRIFDPEEASQYVAFLKRFFVPPYKDIRPAIGVYHHFSMMRGVQDYLIYDLSLDKDRGQARTVPNFYKKHEVLMHMLSFREGLVGYMGKQSDTSRKGVAFSERFARALENPEILYSFYNVVAPLKAQSILYKHDTLSKCSDEDIAEVVNSKEFIGSDDSVWKGFYTAARHILHFAMAAQVGQDAEERLLKQYKSRAPNLTLCNKPYKDGEQSKATLWRNNEVLLEMLRNGITDEVDALLTDRSPVVALRERAFAELAKYSRQNCEP